MITYLLIFISYLIIFRFGYTLGFFRATSVGFMMLKATWKHIQILELKGESLLSLSESERIQKLKEIVDNEPA